RSDNRGSESLFPLWLFDEGAPPTANIEPGFLRQIELATSGPADPGDLVAYTYALFHSAAYRARYEAALRVDFPRILIPGSRTLFESLARLGRQLVDVHLLRGDAA